MVVVISIAVVAVLIVLAFVIGHHSLRNTGPSSAGVGNAFGGMDVFDPARGRMKEELDSKETEGEMFAAPDEEDRPVRVDLHTGKVHIRKTPPPA